MIVGLITENLIMLTSTLPGLGTMYLSCSPLLGPAQRYFLKIQYYSFNAPILLQKR